jgi:hypothetical protein
MQEQAALAAARAVKQSARPAALGSYSSVAPSSSSADSRTLRAGTTVEIACL